ncbi:prenyltransferase [Streptomyces albus subsp. chlorinus]|uniref:prenyltransferase/squalene oxidase repeat-containing protein n=1 Tax=Streptomyces albus TaxID=1888 RepID=UPI00156FC64A|nr:prenyltransferase/squalene oxidase repeat-containing protein [Streptomyces albus]NSC20077.1 prenyltransferase [Streptomyces albus subsp. chlorinus]
MPENAVTARAGRAVLAGAEALFGARREDGVVTPPGDRFSPANTAAALIALHTSREPATDASGPAVDPATADRVVATDRATAVRDRAVARLLAAQRPDGGWAMDGVPTETLTTAVVASALALTAPGSTGTAVAKALALVRRRGGPGSLPEPAMTGLARQFAALAGQDGASAPPRLPLGVLLVPGVARRALSLRLPIFAALALGQPARRRTPVGRLLDTLGRQRALDIVREVFARERGTGSFSSDPWLTSLITLGISRSGLAPDIVVASRDWLVRGALPDGGWALMPLDLTWSSFATAALLEAGYARDPRLDPVAEMFRRRQQDTPFPALGTPAGFWGFSTDRSWPMALETAEISSLLRRLPGGADDRHAARGLAWLTAMQDRPGSWSLAVRDSRPGGFGPCPQMTAKAVTALLDCGAGPRDPRVLRGLRSVARAMRADGGVEAMWYRGLTPGTAAALVAFARAGRARAEPAVRARAFLLATQRPDGSWHTGGHDPAAGADAGRDESGAVPAGTVEETAWSLHALLVAGTAPDSAPVRSAAAWLLDRQESDGTWPGAAVNEYIRHCYRYPDRVLATALALKALGRLRTATGDVPRVREETRR